MLINVISKLKLLIWMDLVNSAQKVKHLLHSTFSATSKISHAKEINSSKGLIAWIAQNILVVRTMAYSVMLTSVKQIPSI